MNNEIFYFQNREPMSMEGIMNTDILPYILLLWQTKSEFAKYCLKMESKSIALIASKELHLKWQHLLVCQIRFYDLYLTSV